MELILLAINCKVTSSDGPLSAGFGGGATACWAEAEQKAIRLRVRIDREVRRVFIAKLTPDLEGIFAATTAEFYCVGEGLGHAVGEIGIGKREVVGQVMRSTHQQSCEGRIDGGYHEVGKARSCIHLSLILCPGLDHDVLNTAQGAQSIGGSDGCTIPCHLLMVGDAALVRVGGDVTELIREGVTASAAVVRILDKRDGGDFADVTQFVLKELHGNGQRRPA